MLSKQTVRAAIEGKGGNAYFSKGAFCDSSFFYDWVRTFCLRGLYEKVREMANTDI